METRGRADLHVHSCWSDGAQSPETVVLAAAERHLDVIAIADHDEIRGALRACEFAAAHPQLGVEVVVGEEISTLNGHLLGLWLSERVPPGLSALRTIELICGSCCCLVNAWSPCRERSHGRHR